jgi:hypothetical protein
VNRPQFWKDELLREDLRLTRRLEEDGAKHLVERSMMLEKFAFVTAYMMRKLAEGDILTLDVTESRWPVLAYRCIVPPPHRHWFQISEDGRNWRQPIEQHYDLANPAEATLDFEAICNRLIHHFAFDTRYDDRTGEIEILFNSDHSTDRLFAVKLTTYREIVFQVARDEVMWVDMNKAEGRVIQRRTQPRDW